LVGCKTGSVGGKIDLVKYKIALVKNKIALVRCIIDLVEAISLLVGLVNPEVRTNNQLAGNENTREWHINQKKPQDGALEKTERKRYSSEGAIPAGQGGEGNVVSSVWI